MGSGTFKARLAELAPWMHHFKFDEKMYTGYYKTAGLGEQLTFCHEESNEEDIGSLSKAFAQLDHMVWNDFLIGLFDRLHLESLATKTILDISSATGKNSIIAVDYGFGQILSSEIRGKLCRQQTLLYDCMEDKKYKENIEVSNDTISADSPDFNDLYQSKNVDVVLSSGLLYHLANPIQHLQIYFILRKSTPSYIR